MLETNSLFGWPDYGAPQLLESINAFSSSFFLLFLLQKQVEVPQ
jgi:hypothetical protein